MDEPLAVPSKASKHRSFHQIYTITKTFIFHIVNQTVTLTFAAKINTHLIVWQTLVK